MPRRRRAAKRKRRRRTSSNVIDAYPEELIGQVTTVANVSWVSTNVQVPLLNLPERAGKARVLEIVKVVTNDAVQAGSGATMVWTIGSVNYGNGQTTTTVPVAQAISDRRNIVSGRMGIQLDEQVDITDSGGHGVYYPAQTLYINGVSGQNAGSSCVFRIFYRVKYVALAEYIGIMNQYIVTIV